MAKLSILEQKTLQMCANGMTSKQIASELGVTAGYVRTQWSLAARLLGAETISHAVKIALKEGWIV